MYFVLQETKSGHMIEKLELLIADLISTENAVLIMATEGGAGITDKKILGRFTTRALEKNYLYKAAGMRAWVVLSISKGQLQDGPRE